jgi:hypothetical protein
MKKLSRKNITTRSVMVLSMMMIASGLMLFSFNLNVIMGIPADIVKGDYLFGRTIGIAEDENGKPLWIISGIWKTNLSNQTQAGSNSTVFDASIDMIKTDGTSKHTHTLTNFVLADTTSQNNVTVFNGTVTISMPKGPITDVPISIKVMNNNLGIIYIDPTKVDNHFGTKPIYGIPLEESEHEESEQYGKKS